MPQQVNPLYGPTGAEGNRFAVAGDLRRMYPIGAAGGLRSIEHVPHQIQSGSMYSYFAGTGTPPNISRTDVFGSQNMISNGSALFGYGNLSNVDAVTYALRLGVTGSTGGNDTAANSAGCGYIFGNIQGGKDPLRTFMFNGDAIVRNTVPATPQLGASNEIFATNVGGTVTVTSGSTSVQGNGTTFTTATLNGAGGTYGGIYVGDICSDAPLRAGDYIRVENTAGTLWSYHRIVSVNAASGAGALTVTPSVPFNGTTRPYTLHRTGWTSGWRSRTIQLQGGAATYYNYYGGATLNCFTRNAGAPSTSTHYTAPRTTSGGANIGELGPIYDIAYYKSFMLYMTDDGVIGWSVAGFPTSFLTGFGALDFPSQNVTQVAKGETGITFEYLGDQLIAIFDRSIWQVTATGTVPEFEFYKLPEPTGCFIHPQGQDVGGIPGTTAYHRPSASGRSSVFYWSNDGLMMLTGGNATDINADIHTELQTQFNNESPHVEWEPNTDTVFVTGYQSVGAVGFAYNVPTATWSYVNGDQFESGGSVTMIRGFSGDGKPTGQHMAAALYNVGAERIQWLDGIIGSPFSVGSLFDANSTWASPVISTGDEYGGFPIAGFQIEGTIGQSATFVVYEGRSPYEMVAKYGGAVTYLDNRRLLGRKSDAPFWAVVINISGNQRPMLAGVNVYPAGRGK